MQCFKILLAFLVCLYYFYNRDKQDDSSVNMTVKPSAAMKFYKVVSDEEVSGTEVKLSDVLIMTLQLGDEWTGAY